MNAFPFGDNSEITNLHESLTFSTERTKQKRRGSRPWFSASLFFVFLKDKFGILERVLTDCAACEYILEFRDETWFIGTSAHEKAYGVD